MKMKSNEKSVIIICSIIFNDRICLWNLLLKCFPIMRLQYLIGRKDIEGMNHISLSAKNRSIAISTEVSHSDPEFVCIINGCNQKFTMESMLSNHIQSSHTESVITEKNTIEGIYNRYDQRKIKLEYENCVLSLAINYFKKDQLITISSCPIEGSEITIDQCIEDIQSVCDVVTTEGECDESLQNAEQMKVHEREVEIAVSNKIKYCSTKNNEEKELSPPPSGSQLKTSDQMKSQTTVTSFECTECGRKFRHNRTLEEHMDGIHSNIKQYVCLHPGCRYRTAYRKWSVAHKKKYHSRSKTKLTCNWPECSYTTFNSYYLRQHICNHTDEKPYECQHSGCAKKFKTKITLNNHIETHSEYNNYICDCGQRFKTNPNRWYHKKYHCEQ